MDVSARGAPTNAQWVHPKGRGQAYFPSLFPYHTNVPYQIPGIPPFLKSALCPQSYLDWSSNLGGGGGVQYALGRAWDTANAPTAATCAGSRVSWVLSGSPEQLAT